jgi:site-specific recombinase XerD
VDIGLDLVNIFFKQNDQEIWSNKINAPVSAHRFRHTVATKIANSGLSLKSLQQSEFLCNYLQILLY